jgi:uncharacterized membrane protein YgdD (TMEM256/DUF423 family)
MKHKLSPQDIAKLLDHSATKLQQGTLDGLLSARRTALQHQLTKHPAPVMAWLTEHGLIQHHSMQHHKAFNWGMAALLVAVLFSGALYMQQSYDHDHSDTDIAILTDDLPIDVYID